MRVVIESVMAEKNTASIMVKVVMPKPEYMAKIWDPKATWSLEWSGEKEEA